MDGSGNTVWKETYEVHELNYDTGVSVQKLHDGGFVILGRTTRDDSTHAVVIRTNENGKQKGIIRHPLMTVWDIKQTSDDGFILTGQRSESVILYKIDKNVMFEWEKTYDIKGYNDRGEGVFQTDDEGYLVYCLGGTKEFCSWDIHLLKTDINGNLENEIIIGDEEYADIPQSITQTTDGGYIIGAERYINGRTVGLLIKLDSELNTEFAKTFESFSNVGHVEQTSDGGYIIAGQVEEETNSVFQYYDVLVIKTDSNGFIDWQKTYTNDLRSYDSAFSIHQTSDNGFIIGAQSRKDVQNNYDIMLIRTNIKGDISKSRLYSNDIYYHLKVLLDKFPIFQFLLK